MSESTNNVGEDSCPAQSCESILLFLNMKSKSRVEGMKLRTTFALAGAVFLLASCKSEEKPSGEVRNGVYIQTFEGSYICVKLVKFQTCVWKFLLS